MNYQDQPKWSHDPNLTFAERLQALREALGPNPSPMKLSPEVFWETMHPQLIDHGYILRPRYREGWTPSWKSLVEPVDDEIEDAIVTYHSAFIDAQRMEDNVTVALKKTIPSHAEAEIAAYLSSKPLRSDPRNHCVPILDILTVNDGTYDWKILVMPLLRKFDSPDFETVGDCMSFVHQILEGICFIHEHGVAHRDCTGANIMMDATELFPDGWHPQAPRRSRDAKRTAVVKSRRSLRAPIKYYFADWGLSSWHSLDDPDPRVVGTFGKDERPPELSGGVPYNPFRLDIHILGGLFSDAILMKTSSLDFLRPLVQTMTKNVPKERPSASEAFQTFEEIRALVTPRQLRSRLKPRTEQDTITRIFLDFVDVIREASYVMWKYLGFYD